MRASAAREGVETVELEMERTISLWKDLKSLWRLFLLFRRERRGECIP